MNKPVSVKVITDTNRITAWEFECVESIRKSNQMRLGENIGYLRKKKRSSKGKIKQFLLPNIITSEKRINIPQKKINEMELNRRPFDIFLFLSYSLDFRCFSRLRSRPVCYFSFGESPPGYPVPYYLETIQQKRLLDVSLKMYYWAEEENKILNTGTYRNYLYSYQKTLRTIFSDLPKWIRNYSWNNISKRKSSNMAEPLYQSQDVKNDEKNPPFNLTNLFIKMVFHLLKKIYRFQFVSERWNIGILRMPIEKLWRDGLRDRDIHWFGQPSSRYYYADPFYRKFKDNWYLFYEKYDQAKENGKIYCIQLNLMEETQSYSGEKNILSDEETHFAFPFIIEHNQEIYMIPNKQNNPGLSIYKSRKFPFKWTHHENININKKIFDPVILRYSDKFWLFFTDGTRGGNSHLYLYYSSNLQGNWTPHQNNPVKIDPSSSRSAGDPFRVNGIWYRPAQNCSTFYGESIVINRIKKLTKSEFKEEKIGELTPKSISNDINGIHHLSFGNNCIILDGNHKGFSGYEFKRKWKKILKTPKWSNFWNF